MYLQRKNKHTAIFHYDLRMYFYLVQGKPSETLYSKSVAKLSFTIRVLRAQGVNNPPPHRFTDSYLVKPSLTSLQNVTELLLSYHTSRLPRQYDLAKVASRYILRVGSLASFVSHPTADKWHNSQNILTRTFCGSSWTV